MDIAQKKKEVEQKLNDEWAKIESEKRKLDGNSKILLYKSKFDNQITKNFSRTRITVPTHNSRTLLALTKM